MLLLLCSFDFLYYYDDLILIQVCKIISMKLILLNIIHKSLKEELKTRPPSSDFSLLDVTGLLKKYSSSKC